MNVKQNEFTIQTCPIIPGYFILVNINVPKIPNLNHFWFHIFQVAENQLPQYSDFYEFLKDIGF